MFFLFLFFSAETGDEFDSQNKGEGIFFCSLSSSNRRVMTDATQLALHLRLPSRRRGTVTRPLGGRGETHGEAVVCVSYQPRITFAFDGRGVEGKDPLLPSHHQSTAPPSARGAKKNSIPRVFLGRKVAGGGDCAGTGRTRTAELAAADMVFNLLDRFKTRARAHRNMIARGEDAPDTRPRTQERTGRRENALLLGKTGDECSLLFVGPARVAGKEGRNNKKAENRKKRGVSIFPSRTIAAGTRRSPSVYCVSRTITTRFLPPPPPPSPPLPPPPITTYRKTSKEVCDLDAHFHWVAAHARCVHLVNSRIDIASGVLFYIRIGVVRCLIQSDTQKYGIEAAHKHTPHSSG